MLKLQHKKKKKKERINGIENKVKILFADD